MSDQNGDQRWRIVGISPNGVALIVLFGMVSLLTTGILQSSGFFQTYTFNNLIWPVVDTVIDVLSTIGWMQVGWLIGGALGLGGLFTAFGRWWKYGSYYNATRTGDDSFTV